MRTTLLNAAIVGKQVRNGERVDAPWPAIIKEDDQQRLADLLNDPTRRVSTSNVPRWLLSGFATCGYPLSVGGICGLPLIVNGSVPGYRGLDCRGHQIRRDAAKVDAFVGGFVVTWLDEYAGSDRLRPPPRPDVDVWALRHELRRLSGRREQFRKASATSDANPADVDKRECDSFAGTGLSGLVPEAATVVVAGMQSEWCVRETSLAALRHGYPVVLVRGAHATYDGEAPAQVTSRAVEAELGAAGVSVIDPAAIRF